MGQTVDFSGLTVAENGYYSNAEISLADTLPTIVVYMDSSICHSCAVGHLHDLDESLGCYSEEERPYNQVIILSSPRKGEQSVLASTRYYSGLSTFLVDKANVFLANNAFIPQDQRFHTFLLDASGHIVLVGDPRGGDKIKSLYHECLAQP